MLKLMERLVRRPYDQFVFPLFCFCSIRCSEIVGCNTKLFTMLFINIYFKYMQHVCIKGPLYCLKHTLASPVPWHVWLFMMLHVHSVVQCRIHVRHSSDRQLVMAIALRVHWLM